MAVRFGSRGGSDQGIQLSSYAVLTQTMPIDNLELWDVFVVRGTVNTDGTGWVDNSFSVNPIYGGGKSELYRDVVSSTYPISLSLEILDGLQTRIDADNNTVTYAGAGNEDGRRQAAGEEIVGVIMSYKAETILGVEDYFGQDVEITSEKYMTVHAVSEQTRGCDVYPIAISSSARGFEAEKRDNEKDGQLYYTQTSTNYQPQVEAIGNLARYDYPTDAKGLDQLHWRNFRIPSGNGVPRSVDDALEGDIFILEAGTAFEWVFYGNNPADSTTAIDMVWPGNSRIYDSYNFSFPDSSPGEGLHIGDRIKHATNNAIENNQGRVGNAWGSVEPHIDVGRSIRIPVINFQDFDTASSDNFKIASFLIVKLLGHGTLENGTKFLAAEVVKVDTSCGQVAR